MTDENKRTKELSGSLPYFFGVIISFLVAFYIRTLPKAGVFLSNGFVRFGGNDPWYHLRNVESILHNFPRMLWFDAYTTYPFGTKQVFAPLYDMFLAAIIWVLGAGNPSQDLIYKICAYYPSFLGALVLIPTYFAAKWIFDDRRIGLLAVFILAVQPGQFLSRAIIGFNDHHIAETLLSTVTAMFFIMALKMAGKSGISLERIKNKEFESLKPALPYLLLAGISLGAYALAWKGALFFAFILGVYITVQHIFDHMKGKKTEYLAISGMVIFAVAIFMIMFTPFLGGTKSMYIKGLFAGILAFPVLTGISLYMTDRKLPKFYYPIALIVLFGAGILLAKAFIPSVYGLMMSIFSYFMRTGGALTVAEASPFFSRGGLEQLYLQFAFGGYVVFLGLALLVYEISRRNGQEKNFLLIWTLMILWAMLQQNRFAYYFSVNVAILSAYFVIAVSDRAGLKSFTAGLKAKMESPSGFSTLGESLKTKSVVSVLLALFLSLLLIVPSYGLALEYAQGTGGPNGPWIEATLWMRSNTPDPGFDYYENYEIPADGELYPYPDTAYGVMSWWDYGHWIEVIGRRIPNANPFQQGIGGRRNSLEEENKPGASTFFTAQSEEEATAVLEAIHPDPDKAAARYIVSDVEMATGKFYAMAAWTLDTDRYYESTYTGNGYQALPAMRYYDSMEARLHLFDGTGLEHYRMVHETWPGQTAEVGYKQVFNYFYLTQVAADDPRGKLDEVDTGYVKIFEYVKGAKITGTASPNEKVTINTSIMTAQGRGFEYSQSTTADAEGGYEFTVPYSTEGPISGETQFDTAPIKPYLVSYGSTTKEVRVSEEAVLNGEEIKV
ncbi:oligosaccharyl transferase, archaeosortase A system-associated [Methanosarcina sp. KYL-1]|uniref:oligosaccharyl transferase, archaeosortase A system-associated n=1 Tax=Methanosarcina sp. KYL-1 TaxID=2602068 RepID=UPI0021009CCA|nr:oligosaccharyl transferase, archaeosortase A system-associated [Methanosarcina sp. KYL-1]MCQ1535192.1 oligosaccharyl transferase, archaeosortase A system-associated [Methanosarcina sp. KYL-1]